MEHVYLAFLMVVAGLILVPLSQQADEYFKRKESKLNTTGRKDYDCRN